MIAWGHTLISLPVIVIATFLGYGLEATITISLYWAGREIAQAEYRWMVMHDTNRAGKPWWAKFTKDAWNRKGLIDDLLLPGTICTLVWLGGMMLLGV